MHSHSHTHSPEEKKALLLRLRKIGGQIAGIEKMVALESGDREPVKITGPACRWCPLFAECAEGQSAMAVTDDDSVAAVDIADEW